MKQIMENDHKLIMENWRNYQKSERLDEEMQQFFKIADEMFLLEEGAIGDFFKGIPGWFKEKWNALKDIAKQAGLKVKEAYNVLKQNPILYKILSFFEWGYDKLLELLKKTAKIWAEIQTAAADYISNVPGLKQALAAGKNVAGWIDDFLEKHPNLKAVGGVVVGGILILIWFNMAFTGDADYDFDQSTLLAALSGDYDLRDLFFSAAGKRLLMLLAVGTLAGASFPWLAAATSGTKLAVSIFYTLGKKAVIKEEIV